MGDIAVRLRSVRPPGVAGTALASQAFEAGHGMDVGESNRSIAHLHVDSWTGVDRRSAPYPVFLCCGLLCWNAFSESLTMAADSIVNARNVLYQPGFRPFMMPMVVVTMGMIHFVLSCSILAVLLAYYRVPLGWPVVALPLLLGIQGLLTLALAFPLAALSVSFHDTKHLLSVALRFLFFLTPILYATTPSACLPPVLRGQSSDPSRPRLPRHIDGPRLARLVWAVGRRRGVTDCADLRLSVFRITTFPVHRGYRMNPAVRVDNLGKRFRRYPVPRSRSIKEALLVGWRNPEATDYFWVFREVSFEVLPGEMLGIIGRNGAGKSTLLSLTAGLLRADEGSIRLRGHVSALLDLGRSLHPLLTGRENPNFVSSQRHD